MYPSPFLVPSHGPAFWWFYSVENNGAKLWCRHSMRSLGQITVNFYILELDSLKIDLNRLTIYMQVVWNSWRAQFIFITFNNSICLPCQHFPTQYKRKVAVETISGDISSKTITWPISITECYKWELIERLGVLGSQPILREKVDNNNYFI